MTRAYALLASLLLIATPLAGCTSSPEIEEIIDDILGCMDENAENYDDNATAELLGDCFYLASMEAFMTAATEQMEIDEMLEIIPRAGYSMSITMSEWNTDMNMQTDTVIEEMVMADLDTDSVYVKMGMSMVPFMTYEYIQVQVGELVNIHYTMGGMLAAENAGMGSYQTRDADPDVMDVISSLVSVSDAGDTGEEIGLDLPTGDLSDLSSEMPADTEPVITFEDETGVHTMTLEYTNDTGHDISIVILIDENEDLMSYEISTDYGSRNAPGSASSSISYTVMWGDAVVIEVDDTLPRTSIPINFHIEGMPEDDGGDDTFYCDNGNEIPMDSVDDGWDDCGDGSDESDDGDDVFVCDNGEEIPAEWENDGGEDCSDGSDENYVSWIDYEGGYCEWNTNDTGWWCKYSEEDEDWDSWWYYCENHDSDWHCTDDFGQSEDYEHSADGTEWSGSGDDDDGPPTPEEAMYAADANGDGYVSPQEFEDFWESDPSNPELDSEEVAALFDDCDYDGNDLIDIDEMQCFIDGIGAMLGGFGEDPEQMMDYMDTDDDGYLSLQEFFDYLNGEREQNGEPPMTSEDEDAYAAWFYSGDADGDDLLSLDEFTQLLDSTGDDDGEEPPTAENFVDWFDTDGDGVLTLDEIIDGIRNTNNVSGELPPSAEDEAYMEAAFNDADENADGVLDLDELGHFIYVIDGDDDGDEEGDDEPFQVTMMVLDQTLNAPISDFEVRFLGDCGEPDEEGNEPPISECTVYASNGLTEGSATVDPEVAEYEFTWSYLDYDGDGMISTMDTLVIDNLMPGVQVELYDTWADQYTSDSFASAEMLPGFGALMAVVVLLGAAFATRRD